jgi:hypothetical protein
MAYIIQGASKLYIYIYIYICIYIYTYICRCIKGGPMHTTRLDWYTNAQVDTQPLLFNLQISSCVQMIERQQRLCLSGTHGLEVRDCLWKTGRKSSCCVVETLQRVVITGCEAVEGSGVCRGKARENMKTIIALLQAWT